MKAFIKYDFYFQIVLYFTLLVSSSLSDSFRGNFAVSLFVIGCSQTISYVVRLNQKEKNVIFNIYTIGYCIFLLSILMMIVAKLEFIFWFTVVLINIMALLFLISSFIDYKNRESINF